MSFRFLLLALGMSTAALGADSPWSGYTSLELKLGSLYPDIDSSPGLNGATPYATTFNNSSMLFFQMDGEHFIWSKYGSAGFGLSVGYGEKYAQSQYATGGAVSGIKSGLQLIPLKAFAVYRFDYAMKRWGVPFVPFAKLGLIWEPWLASVGGNTEQVNGQSGEGARWGYSWSLGISFLLDVIDEGLAKDARVDTGIDHMHLLVEYDDDTVEGFGSAGIDLSSSRLMFGLALDF